LGIDRLRNETHALERQCLSPKVMSKYCDETVSFFTVGLEASHHTSTLMASVWIPKEKVRGTVPSCSPSAAYSKKWREKKKQTPVFLENERKRKKIERKRMSPKIKDQTREKTRLRQQTYRQRQKTTVGAGRNETDNLKSSDGITKPHHQRTEEGKEELDQNYPKIDEIRIIYGHNEESRSPHCYEQDLDILEMICNADMSDDRYEHVSLAKPFK